MLRGVTSGIVIGQNPGRGLHIIKELNSGYVSIENTYSLTVVTGS